MLRVGITGGIGTGKSLVCKLFELYNIPVFNADNEAKNIVDTNAKVKESIINLLGNESYTASGEYNKAFIAAQIFANAELRQQLNAIIHPAVALAETQWQLKHEALAMCAYTLRESALIFELGLDKKLEKVIGVHCPTEIVLQRVTKRNPALSVTEIEARMSSQMPNTTKMELCHYVIHNYDPNSLITQVQNIHNLLCAESKIA